MKNIRLLLIVFLLVPALSILAQERRVMRIPDIPGYETLVCDFHLHTVFSDGKVWPTVRVDEAWREGLDAIAITDHLEYLPHKDDMRTDHNRAWQIARDYATGRDVIVIAGTEITKKMPPGHLNALFIKDAGLVLQDHYLDAIEEAAGQGAFIMWNHPGWKAQQPDTMKWWKEHTLLYDRGWLHGIEVVNHNEQYPGAVDWAMEKGLTMIGSSDQHEPFLFTSSSATHHRSCTFVFSNERTEGGIREALFSGRTAAYFGNQVIGRESLLKAFFMAAVQLRTVDASRSAYALVNPTDLEFELVLENSLYGDWEKTIKLEPGSESYFNLQPEAATDEIGMSVMNFITGSDEVLRVNLSDCKTGNTVPFEN